MMAERDAGAHDIHLRVCDGHEDMSARAADLIADEIRLRPSLLLCAATGSTPTRTYGLLAAKAETDAQLSGRLRVMKLDEWGGLDADDPGSCESYLRQHLVGPLGIPEDRYFGFRGDAADPEAECRRVRQVLEEQGPIDLCILGIGTNGHLALNEPADELRPRVHVAELTDESLQHPMLRGSRSRPRFGLTLGMADVLRSRKIILLASGAHKRGVMRRLFTSDISTRLPASFLRLHPQVFCFCDRAAAGP